MPRETGNFTYHDCDIEREKCRNMRLTERRWMVGIMVTITIVIVGACVSFAFTTSTAISEQRVNILANKEAIQRLDPKLDEILRLVRKNER